MYDLRTDVLTDKRSSLRTDVLTDGCTFSPTVVRCRHTSNFTPDGGADVGTIRRHPGRVSEEEVLTDGCTFSQFPIEGSEIGTKS
jgi:hypothetical protein